MISSGYPDDDNGDVLRRMERSGDDLSKSRDINFSVVFEDRSSAVQFVNALIADGVRAELESDDIDSGSWDVTVTVPMVPTHGGITGVEDHLEKLATSLGGWNDGWGCFAVPVGK